MKSARRVGWAGGVSIRRLLMVLALACGASATAQVTSAVAAGDSETLQARACPAGLDAFASCYSALDRNGAYILAAVPKGPNGTLIVHAHGGPRHIDPKPDGSDADLVRFSAMVKAGYSWIGSTFRTGGYGVRQAAIDVDESRRLFWNQFGRPDRTVLHGQSYGGNVVAKLAELAALDDDGHRKYDGVILTSAAVGRRIETYNKLIDLRVVYQYYCRNLPRPDEDQYPAWLGLPKQSSMSREEVGVRVNACTGADLPASARTPQQSRNLAEILSVTGEKAANLTDRMELTTVRFQDVINNFLNGAHPFDSTTQRYRGSSDDDALNKGVERFAGTSQARDRLAYDLDVHGGLVVPTITLQAKYDPVVDYRGQAHYRNVVAHAGQSHLLLQLLTSEKVHSKLSDSEYLASLSALTDWIDNGRRPTVADVWQRCDRQAKVTGQPCLFIDYAVD